MNGLTAESVYERFTLSAQRWPDRDLLLVMPDTARVYDIEPGAINYATAHASVNVLSTRFKDAGFSAGMRVAVLLENRPDFFLVFLALNKLGCSIVPINPDLRATELEYLIAHSEPALVIGIASRLKDLTKAASAANVPVQVITLDEEFAAPPGSAVVTQNLSTGERETALLYTSGTTGQPKGCVLSNHYFLLAGQWYADVGGLVSLHENGERMITPLPLFHMNAMAYSFMAMLTVGGCLCVLDRFHPSSWWSDVVASKATCLHYLGVMPSMLMKAESEPVETQHTVRFGFGAGIDPKLQADFESRFGFALVEAWAMTETGAGAVVAASTQDRLIGQSCLGKPADDIEYRLVDDAGQDVQDPLPGELWVRHAGEQPRFGFFTHYYKDEEATNEAWQQGWFHTGDIVRRDTQGNLYFVDRKKNVIRRSGENIAAVDVESVLMKHPSIVAAAVTAVPDALRGDEVFACIKLAADQAASAQQIMDFCLSQMAYYKAPGYIAFVNELPLTATQKIQRAVLKDKALHLLTSGAAQDLTALKKRQTLS